MKPMIEIKIKSTKINLTRQDVKLLAEQKKMIIPLELNIELIYND